MRKEINLDIYRNFRLINYTLDWQFVSLFANWVSQWIVLNVKRPTEWTNLLKSCPIFTYRISIEELCISQFQLRPSPPGNCGAFVGLVSPGGGALANSAWPGGRAFVYPRAFDTHVVSNSKSKHGGFYEKGPAVLADWLDADWLVRQS